MTIDTKRYFSIDFSCIWFTAVARDEAHAIELVRGWFRDGDDDYDERAARSAPVIRELSESEAATKQGWDDARDGGSYPLNTFEMGALLSSEY